MGPTSAAAAWALLLLHGASSIPYSPLNFTHEKCEFILKSKGPAFHTVPAWANSGQNPIAIAFFGSVSYRDKQAHEVNGLETSGGGDEFVCLGPTARHYERFLFQPNNFQVLPTDTACGMPTAAARCSSTND